MVHPLHLHIVMSHVCMYMHLWAHAVSRLSYFWPVQ